MINYLYNTRTKTIKKLRSYKTKEMPIQKSLKKLIWILSDDKAYSLNQIATIYYGKCTNKEQVKINLKKLSEIMKLEQITRIRYGRELEYEYKLKDRIWITND